MLKLLSPAFFLGILGGCMVEDNNPAAATLPRSAEAGADSITAFPKLGKESMSIRPGNKEFAYREPGTGIQYLINPQWKIMTRQPKGPAESAAALQSWTDWSGQVETRVYECASPAFTQHQNSVGCQVEPDFILIGGGAYAAYLKGPGALLWESRPLDRNLGTWVASSKDHEVASLHRLYVYSIGMRLKDFSGKVLPKALVQAGIQMIGHNAGTPSHAPADSVGGISRRRQMNYFGVGARLNWTCCGALLIQSKVMYEGNWMIGIAAGKDHRYSDPSGIDAYGIATEADQKLAPYRKSFSIPGFGRMEFKILEGKGGAVDSGVAVALLDVEQGYVLAGIGGESVWTSGGGRMLFGMKPAETHAGRIGVYSKDHGAVSGGYNVANLVQIRRAY
jgi:hypothetical protein